MSYNTRNSGRGMYMGRHMGLRPPMGRGSPRMPSSGRNNLRSSQNQQPQSQPQPLIQSHQYQPPQSQPVPQPTPEPKQTPPSPAPNNPAVPPPQTNPPKETESPKEQQKKPVENNTVEQTIKSDSTPEHPERPQLTNPYSPPPKIAQPEVTVKEQEPVKQSVQQGASSSADEQQLTIKREEPVSQDQTPMEDTTVKMEQDTPNDDKFVIVISDSKDDSDIEMIEGTLGVDKDSTGRDEKKKAPRQWHRKPGFNVRLSKKIRKRRQNARLRHILCPKNAMMVLHELHPELKIVATEQLNAANQMVYTVEIEIEGKTYRGHGMSKLLAKQAGCENALKAVLLEKMAKSNMKVVDTEPMRPAHIMDEETSGNNGPSMNQSSEDFIPLSTGGPVRKNHAEDDVPWGSLASFALYKLFSEWQSQGYQLPVAATTNLMLPAPPQRTGGFQMAPMKKIPEDANRKHPVQLLNQLRPGSQYSEQREGNPPNLMFTFTVVVDGQTYQGVGSNKKDAKKECAKSALMAMGVKYD